jgi:hypothetical protein
MRPYRYILVQYCWFPCKKRGLGQKEQRNNDCEDTICFETLGHREKNNPFSGEAERTQKMLDLGLLTWRTVRNCYSIMAGQAI